MSIFLTNAVFHYENRGFTQNEVENKELYKKNPLKYHKNYDTITPVIFTVCFIIFCIDATQTSAERIFTEDRRSTMWYQAHSSPELTENLVMRHNILVNNDRSLNQQISEKLNEQLVKKHSGNKKLKLPSQKKSDKTEIDEDDDDIQMNSN